MDEPSGAEELPAGTTAAEVAVFASVATAGVGEGDLAAPSWTTGASEGVGSASPATRITGASMDVFPGGKLMLLAASVYPGGGALWADMAGERELLLP